jgi:hypothetical protein
MNLRIHFVSCTLYSIAKESAKFLTGDFLVIFGDFWPVFGGLSKLSRQKSEGLLENPRQIWGNLVTSVWTKVFRCWTDLHQGNPGSFDFTGLPNTFPSADTL